MDSETHIYALRSQIEKRWDGARPGGDQLVLLWTGKASADTPLRTLIMRAVKQNPEAAHLQELIDDNARVALLPDVARDHGAFTLDEKWIVRWTFDHRGRVRYWDFLGIGVISAVAVGELRYIAAEGLAVGDPDHIVIDVAMGIGGGGADFDILS